MAVIIIYHAAAMQQAPIGVFDSGVGGLSVLAELRTAMPHEDFLYLGDTAHVPYGTREPGDIIQLTDRAVTALCSLGVKAVVVACNTAAAFSLSHLRERFPCPIIGLVPAVKPAVLATTSGVIAVLATPATFKGPLFQQVIQDFAVPAGIKVIEAINTALVPLVEAGLADSPQARTELRRTLEPVRERGADHLVLGCTHYPFLKRSIEADFRGRFTLLDSGTAVAQQTHKVLAERDALNRQTSPGGLRLLVSGDPLRSQPVIETLLRESGQALPSPLLIEQVPT